MSNQIATTQNEEHAEGNMEICIRTSQRQQSPSMFDDDLPSVIGHSQPSHNQMISTQKSPLPSQWNQNFSVPSIGCNELMIPSSSNRMAPVHLSISSTEFVTTCHNCDNNGSLNQITDKHNRSLDVEDFFEFTPNGEDGFVSSVIASAAKRQKLNESVEFDATNFTSNFESSWANSSSPDTCDILERLAESTNTINDQLVSLHEDWYVVSANGK